MKGDGYLELVLGVEKPPIFVDIVVSTPSMLLQGDVIGVFSKEEG